MAAIEVQDLTYRYGTRVALDELRLDVPAGSLYALLGPNGAGKSTLMQVVMGLRRPFAGRAVVLGTDSRRFSAVGRRAVSYVAEGQRLPGWMQLEQLEAYLAPFYPSWDRALAGDLRDRFGLDPRRRFRTLSRGERMKAALLCALAPRPRLLLMDEPFSGIDALVKDDLVRGLLEASGQEGWTVLLASHDIGELEMLADRVGVLANGRMRLSASMDEIRAQYHRVDVIVAEDVPVPLARPAGEWLSLERSGRHLAMLWTTAGGMLTADIVRRRIPGAVHVETRAASLREVFIALAREARSGASEEIAA